MKRKSKQSPAVRAALLGILAAEALALSFIESLLPTAAFLPPGLKPGLANVVTMFTLSALGFPEAMAIVIIKSLFTFITRGASSFIMSISGGIVSAAVMILLIRLKNTRLGYVGISVISAVSHNMAQLVAASILAGSNVFRAYIPAVLLFGAGAGVLTGVLLKAVMPVLLKQMNHLYTYKPKTNEKDETRRSNGKGQRQ